MSTVQKNFMKSAAAIMKMVAGSILKRALILSKKIDSIADEDFFEENHFCKRYKVVWENPNLLICFKS